MDDDEFVRWLTYAQLAESRGISKDSATRMAFRNKWRRQVGNDGTARVAVPAGQDKPSEMAARVTKQDDATPGVMVWEAAIVSLTDARNQAQKRAEMAETAREAAETRVIEERARADSLRDRLDVIQDELRQARAAADQVREHVREAEDALAELRQADAVRRGQGRLARLRAAWRGEC
jgi:hypothetical protein